MPRTPAAEPAAAATPAAQPSQLGQWPCQIKLVPVNAPYFRGAKLLIAADCTAYAYANMHSEFMKGKITLIGCPKLDAVDYTDKLTEIIRGNDIQSVTIVRMEVRERKVPAMAGRYDLDRREDPRPLSAFFRPCPRTRAGPEKVFFLL